MTGKPSSYKLSTISLSILMIVAFAAAGPIVGGEGPTAKLKLLGTDLSRVAILGTQSVHLQQGATVSSGDVVANAAGSGPTLGCNGSEMCVGIGATTAAGFTVAGDSVQLKQGAHVGGDVHYNDLASTGTIDGAQVTPLGLPAFDPLPAFQQAEPRPEAVDVTVGSGQTVELAAGDYRDITTQHDAVVRFAGGFYDVGSIDAGDRARLEFLAPATVRVAGRLSTSEDGYVGTASGAGVPASEVVFHVAGINGSTGSLGATPKAVKFGLDNVVLANVYAPNGTIHLRQGTVATGAFLGRDVDVGVGVEVSLASAFGNRAPTAHPQSVFTSGPTTITLTLTGSDPDGDDLIFSIATEPDEGALGSVVQGPAPFPGNPPGCNPENDPFCDPPEPPRTSATVTYAPFTGEDLEDSFTFQVADPSGAVGVATVSINPPDDPTPPPDEVTTVVAFDGEAETAVELAVTVTLSAGAPCEDDCDGVGDDVPLTFSVDSEDARLSDLTQGSEDPQRSATVVYTPAEDFSGLDSFDFEVCGTIAEVETCDVGTVTVAVSGELADDQVVITAQDTPVAITLTGTAGAGTKRLIAKVSTTNGAAVAGAVADSDDDELGDEHNALPGAVPAVASAAVDASGGPGSNGTVRFQVEWALADLGSGSDLQRAEVVLHTLKGTVDGLDTFFFFGSAEQDGLLTDSDFEAGAQEIPGVVMPVPESPVGTEGTFSFDVTELLRADLAAGRDFFSVQGRVDEGLEGGGSARGLQIRTTATGNLSASLEPALVVDRSGLTFTLLTLPAHGTLRDFQGVAITAVPSVLASPRLTYVPASGFDGFDDFTFEADDGLAVATGLIDITVIAGFIDPCLAVGRPLGCAPTE